MDLDQQIQSLIDNAPADGITPKLIAAIAPGLKLLAQKLHHRQYFILQGLEQNWLVTTLSDRTNPEIEKRVVYAYPTLKDASAGSASSIEPQVIAFPMPVTQILFQLTALETVDSIVFFDTPGNLSQGIEIRRKDMQQLIQLQLKPQSSPAIPPDIA